MLKRFLPSEMLLALNQDNTVLNRFKHIFEDQRILKELKNNQKLLDFFFSILTKIVEKTNKQQQVIFL